LVLMVVVAKQEHREHKVLKEPMALKAFKVQ
jgi:hypothetical protein